MAERSSFSIVEEATAHYGDEPRLVDWPEVVEEYFVGPAAAVCGFSKWVPQHLRHQR